MSFAKRSPLPQQWDGAHILRRRPALNSLPTLNVTPITDTMLFALQDDYLKNCLAADLERFAAQTNCRREYIKSAVDMIIQYRKQRCRSEELHMWSSYLQTFY